MKGAPFWEKINYQFLNLFLVLFFVQAGFIVAANNFPYDTDVLADDLFKNPSRMAKFIIKPPEVQPKPQGPKGEKKDDPGEAAEKHKGDEGQMGKKDAPKTNARSAPKAIDPNAKEIVKRTGLLAALGRGGGGLSTVFGTGGLGGDLRGAVGNMFGPVVGDSYGLGGLGIRGSGSGGGGQGETIGIGAVGTKGRGGGLGSYGTGRRRPRQEGRPRREHLHRDRGGDGLGRPGAHPQGHPGSRRPDPLLLRAAARGEPAAAGQGLGEVGHQRRRQRVEPADRSLRRRRSRTGRSTSA